MTIHIEKKPFQSFINLRELDNYQVVLVLMLIHHSTSGSARYIHMDKLHFLFDLAICNRSYNGLPKFTIPPWKVDNELKRKLILLSQNSIILQSNINNKVRFSLSEKGESSLKNILEIESFHSLNNKIAELCKNISTSNFEKSRIVF
ncbi:hypothetical protein [Pseudoalteromonas sp. NCCP-2140]|uniref:hypothetical protein n=1 Tax=Pseudoalteromonas sp. NCCP-2140 TaxID=2942288 RepID=UPI00203D1BDC|nr:hypothetical protein [Pseudoalteromonas sp. NCCP-2140]